MARADFARNRVARASELTQIKCYRGGVVDEALDPFELKKSIEVKLQKLFTALANLDRESTRGTFGTRPIAAENDA